MFRSFSSFPMLNVFQCSEVKKMFSVKSSLREVRFHPREVRFTSHQSDTSLLDIQCFSFFFLVEADFLFHV